MSNSSLVNYTRISPNKSKRTAPISKITIHHMAGNLSVESCGNVFASSTRQASSNYGVGSDGRIGLYVPEDYRAWTSSNSANDNVAITIEVANDGGASTNWHCSDKALEATINLCVDICKRNGIKKLNYTGDKNGNLTRHNMFAATTCPGPYLQSRFPGIAEEVNKRLGNNEDTTNNNVVSEVQISMPILQKGATGAEVKTLQRLLNATGCSCGSVDGSFGNQTHNAVIKFQKKYGLVQDGTVGAATWAKLLKGC